MFSRSLVSKDVEEWLVREFEWATTVGLLKKDTPVVTPEKKYFPASKGDAEGLCVGIVFDPTWPRSQVG